MCWSALAWSVERVYKVKEGRPNVVDFIKGERIHLIINTPHGQDTFFDEKGHTPGRGHAAHPNHHDDRRGAGRRRRHRRHPAPPDYRKRPAGTAPRNRRVAQW